MAENDREFHKETTVITPGIDLKAAKKKRGKVGKSKAKTTVFGDV